MSLILPKITDSAEFEKLVKEIAAIEYGQRFTLFGRSGQNQYGIDIFSKDFDKVIQCKNYTTNDKTALKSAIIRDFNTAYNDLYEERNIKFKEFIVYTSVDRDKSVQLLVQKIKQETTLRIDPEPIDISFVFWQDISDYVIDQAIAGNKYLLVRYFEECIVYEKDIKITYTANSLYTKNFTEPMFLHREHKDKDKVNLCSLYVTPKYKNGEYDNPETDLENRLENFTKSTTKRFLLIEGDAGCGKSTLVSWLNYHYAKSDDIGKNICGNRPLITIRLRDLKKETIINSDMDLLSAILEYMHLSSVNQLTQTYQQALIVLDGFDELCMIEGFTDHKHLLNPFQSLNNLGYKFIITSRPHYIDKNIRNISLKKQVDSIILQHFDEEKREEWITHYTSPYYCGQPLAPHIINYIKNIKEDSESVICDTPMTLYMLAAKNVNEELMANSWVLYNYIFFNVLSDSEYDQIFKTADNDRYFSHSVAVCSEFIYKITEEIAFYFYCIRNKHLYIGSNEVQKIIDELLKNGIIKGINDLTIEKTKALLEQNYALCNYWKSAGDAGAVEFYHNNIRDFFLCEKIYRELNEIYSLNHHTAEEKSNQLKELIKFFLQFKKAPLEEMVCRFILLRAQNDIQEKDTISFIYQEKQQRLLPSLFEELLTNGYLYDHLHEQNHIQSIINILSCTAQVYRHIYEPILSENEHIKWWNNTAKIHDSNIIQCCFRQVFELPFVGEEYFSISSRGDFSNIWFIDCSLRRLDLSRADLTWANLSFADLTGASLTGANLTGADLTGADLTEAKLIGAALPDGTQSYEPKEQVRRLKKIDPTITFGVAR